MSTSYCVYALYFHTCHKLCCWVDIGSVYIGKVGYKWIARGVSTVLLFVECMLACPQVHYTHISALDPACSHHLACVINGYT